MADPTPQTAPGKKLFGMPMWVVLSGGTALVVGVYMLWKKKQAASTSTSTTDTSGTSTSSTDTTGSTETGLGTDQYESLLALLRDIQSNQGSDTDTNQTVTAPPPVPSGNPTSGTIPLQGGNPPRNPVATPVKATPSPAKSATTKTVTVAPSPAWNSTLWGISGHEYGTASQAGVDKIYNANKTLINGQEIRHGMTATQAQQRKWLYPGELLTIP